MTISFEDYCDDYLDLSIALMSDEQLASARAGYADLIRNTKTPSEVARHAKALAKAKEARKLAKFYGGKALTGTAAQKKWAEQIREEKLKLMDAEQASLVCDPNGLLTKAAWWIEHRENSAKDIADFVQKQKMLLSLYKKAKAENLADQVAAFANQYNSLTSIWGF